MSEGETDPVKLAGLGHDRLQCGKKARINALRGAPEPVHLQMLKLYLDRLDLFDKQIEVLDQMAATAMKKNEDAVRRLAEVPGLGVISGSRSLPRWEWTRRRSRRRESSLPGLGSVRARTNPPK